MADSTSQPRSDATSSTLDYADVAPETMVQVGFVFRPHGIDGELKVNPEYTDDPTRFEGFERLFLGASPHRVVEYAVSSVRYQETKRGTTVILGLESIQDRTDAEAITKMKVFVAENDLELGEDEVYVHDLVGLDVVTDQGDVLGTVVNYQEMPAQDLFVIRRPGHGETMIPAVEDFILEVDVENGRLVVQPIEGLIEE